MDKAHDEWEQQNRERVREWRRNYHVANQADRVAKAKAWNDANPDAYKANKNSHYRRMKEAAYAAYGGNVCACCGETEPLFLSIDHVNNDQSKYRKQLGHPHTGLRLFVWLRKNGYPEGFQILCHNCNQGKRLNNGVCPHQVKKVQRLSRKGVGSSEPKRPALCEEVMI